MTKTIGHEMRMNTALHNTFGQKNELDINIRDIYAWLFTSFFFNFEITKCARLSYFDKTIDGKSKTISSKLIHN